MNVTDLRRFSAQELEEWQGNPVTVALKGLLDRMVKAQTQQCLNNYWAGKPWPEQDRLSLQRLEAWTEDFFEASIEDTNRMKELMDEYERDQSYGVQRTRATQGDH